MQYQLELKNICKTYGNLKANDNISLAIERGCIHALLGENGAGKSTLVNIIYGLITKDSGDIYWQGKKVAITSPIIARKFGIGIVFQHFALFEALNVIENIILGIGYKSSTDTLKKEVIKISQYYNLAINVDALIADLSAGERQRVEIIRCLLQKPKLLILDEPTSVLTPVETTHLFATLNKLTKTGCAILFIGHKLNEIKSICSQATILRHGKFIGVCDLKTTKISKIAQMMVGSKISEYSTKNNKLAHETILTLKNLNKTSKTNISIKSHRIIGIAGIAGNGQDTLLSVLAGEIKDPEQSIEYYGQDISNWNVQKRNKAGILFIPTERLGRSAVTQMNLQENSLLGILNKTQFVKNGLLKSQQILEFTQKIIDNFNVQTAGTKALAASLSGGNLQKFIIGRTLLQKPKVLLIANPTWGVDIGSAIFIRNKLVELRDAGMAILVASEDLDEMFNICDEMTIIKKGQLSAMYDVHDLTIEKVGIMMTV